MINVLLLNNVLLWEVQPPTGKLYPFQIRVIIIIGKWWRDDSEIVFKQAMEYVL